jgi:all-trans-nonaprenyl-diphosphate synthase
MTLQDTRKNLKRRALAVPKSFQVFFKNAAEQLEEDTCVMINTVALLVGFATASGRGMGRLRALGEALSLFFSAGRLHDKIIPRDSGDEGKKSTSIKILGGDFLYAEGQWVLATLQSLPTIKLVARTVQSFSDGGADEARTESPALEAQLRQAFQRRGAYFAAAATGAFWLFEDEQGEALEKPKAKEAAVQAYCFARDLGCALELLEVAARESTTAGHAGRAACVAACENASRLTESSEAHFELFKYELKRTSGKLSGTQSRALASLQRLIKVVRGRGHRGLRRVLREMESHDPVRLRSLPSITDAEFHAAKESAGAKPSAVKDLLAICSAAGKPIEAKLDGMGYSRSARAELELRRLIRQGLEPPPSEGDGGAMASQAAPPHTPAEATGVPAESSEADPASASDAAGAPPDPRLAMAAAMKCVGKPRGEVEKLLEGVQIRSAASGAVTCSAVDRIFDAEAGGKRLRPALVLLVSKAVAKSGNVSPDVEALAASIEVLHTASLVHDDILDDADTRRGRESTHIALGSKRSATMVGDYLFATSCRMVAESDSIPTIILISKVVADFGRGELAQNALKFDTDFSLTRYLAKSFYKTASLLAAACQASAVMSGESPISPVAQAMYSYGTYVGLAFQVVDDVLDFTTSSEQLGKPAMADLQEGYLSAPVLFTLESFEDDDPQKADLLKRLDRRLSEPGDLESVLDLVEQQDGVKKASKLARRFSALALETLGVLPPSEATRALGVFTEFVVARAS